jgi:hypothetical protein
MKKNTPLKNGWLVAVLSAGLTTSAADAASLLHHWKLDGDATDSGTTGGHDGTEQGDASYTTGGGGKFGEAVSLDGDGDSIFVNQSSLPATDFTLTAWVFRESAGIQMYVAGTQESGNVGTFLRAGFDTATDDRAFVNLLPPGNAKRVAGGAIPLNTWTHLAVTVSSTAGLEIFVNGSSVGTDPAGTGHTTHNNFRIGAPPDVGDTFEFDGLLDDVAIFDGVLSSTQLTDAMNLGAENFDASDATPPQLSTTNPAGGATGVMVSSDLVATFDEPVQAGTAGTITLRKTTPDELVESFDVTSSSQLTFGGSTVTINPSSDLVGGVEYYVLIDAGAVEDITGNDYAGLGAVPPDAGAWSFATDGTAPTSSAMGPMAGASDVLPSADLTLSFDESVQVGTGDIGIFLADGTPVETIDVTSGAVTINGTEVTIDIADLALGTAYYVNIPSGAFTDLSGNPYAGISDTTTWAFTTVPTTLIHHWEFEGDATDSAGTHDGTLEGDATFAAGIIGQAASLDGDGDSIFVGQSSLPATDFTMTAWILRESAGIQMYIAGTQQSGNVGAFLRAGFDTETDDRALVNLLPPADEKRVAGGTIPLDTWTHLAVTVSSTAGLELYVDGSPVATDPAGTDHATHDNFRIGARPDGGTFAFDGLIDDVRIYAEVLSESEIAALAAGGGAPLQLKISQNGGNLDFEWNSMSGMQYDLVSSTDLLTDPATWPVYDDGVNPPYEDIPATGTTTSLNSVVKVGTTRFFALIEEKVPPLLSENFDEATGVPAGWVPADNDAGTVWQVDDPSPGPAEGPDAAASGANCAGTNITAFYTAGADVSLTSPAIAIPAGGATLRFQQYIDTDGSGDVGSVRLLDADNEDAEITDGDFPLTPIEGIEDGWTPRSFPFPAAALDKNVKIRFQFLSDADTDVWSGFYVDDVVVTAN